MRLENSQQVVEYLMRYYDQDESQAKKLVEAYPETIRIAIERKSLVHTVADQIAEEEDLVYEDDTPDDEEYGLEADDL